MSVLRRDKVLVIALHEQRPDQDAVIQSRLYTAIRAYGARLGETARAAGGEAAGEEILKTDVDGVLCFTPATAAIWGAYDNATFYLADDVVSVIRIGSSCGASAHELLFGPLFGTDEDNAEALKALLGSGRVGAPPVILLSRVKLNDPFLAVAGQALRAAFAQAAFDLAKGKALVLVVNAWSSHELAIVLLGSDPVELLKLSRDLECLSMGDLFQHAPTLQRLFEEAIDGAPKHIKNDSVPASILRRWSIGRRTSFSTGREAILDKLGRAHAVVALRAQLGLHLRNAEGVLSSLAEREWNDLPALTGASGRAISLMQPTVSSANESESVKQARFLQVLKDLEELYTGRFPSAKRGAGRPNLGVRIQWLPKPGHLADILTPIEELARRLMRPIEHVNGTGGHGAAVSMQLDVPADVEGCLFLHAITLWFRSTSQVREHLRGTTTLVDDRRPRTEAAPLSVVRVQPPPAEQPTPAPARVAAYDSSTQRTPASGVPVTARAGSLSLSPTAPSTARSLALEPPTWPTEADHLDARPAGVILPPPPDGLPDVDSSRPPPSTVKGTSAARAQAASLAGASVVPPRMATSPPQSTAARTDPGPSALKDARGYALFEYPRTEHLARFERQRLQALGVGSSESLALQNLFATVQHTVSQPEMFGAMLDVCEVTNEIAGEFCHSPDVDVRELSAAIRELTSYAQQAYQQRLQFSTAVDGAPAIGGEVPYGIHQLVGTASGVAAVILGVADRSVGREQPTLPIVILSPNSSVDMRGIRSTGVFRLSSAHAMTPVSFYLLFHELGHWLVRLQCDPEECHSRRRELRVASATIAPLLQSSPGAAGGEDDDLEGWTVGRVEMFLDDILAHAAWRLLGCDDDLALFRTQFLSGPAMGIRTAEPPRTYAAALGFWAETALHLLVQEVLPAHDESILQFLQVRFDLERCRGRSLRDVFDELGGEECIRHVLPFAFAQLESAARSEGASYGRQAMAEALRTAVCCRLVLLQGLLIYDRLLSRERPQAVANLLQKHLDRIVALRGTLRRIEREFTDTCPEYRGLRVKIAAGELPAPPPWDILDYEPKAKPDVRPNHRAFLWVRAVLAGVADHFAAECAGRDRHGVIRGSVNRIELESVQEGIYTDHLGGLYRVGRRKRARCLEVHATALLAMSDLVYRVRAGYIEGYLRRQRSLPRREAGYPVLLRWDRRDYLCRAVDTSPVGLGLQFGADAELPSSGYDAEKGIFDTQIRVHVVKAGAEIPCFVVWLRNIDGRWRIGLKIAAKEPFLWPHWARTEARA